MFTYNPFFSRVNIPHGNSHCYIWVLCYIYYIIIYYILWYFVPYKCFRYIPLQQSKREKDEQVTWKDNFFMVNCQQCFNVSKKISSLTCLICWAYCFAGIACSLFSWYFLTCVCEGLCNKYTFLKQELREPARLSQDLPQSSLWTQLWCHISFCCPTIFGKSCFKLVNIETAYCWNFKFHILILPVAQGV